MQKFIEEENAAKSAQASLQSQIGRAKKEKVQQSKEAQDKLMDAYKRTQHTGQKGRYTYQTPYWRGEEEDYRPKNGRKESSTTGQEGRNEA